MLKNQVSLPISHATAIFFVQIVILVLQAIVKANLDITVGLIVSIAISVLSFLLNPQTQSGLSTVKIAISGAVALASVIIQCVILFLQQWLAANLMVSGSILFGIVLSVVIYFANAQQIPIPAVSIPKNQ